MAPRAALNTANPAAYQSMLTLSEQAEQGALAAGIAPLTVELIRIRVSQLNGCAFCLRMHTRDALDKGETTDRLAVLPAWSESRYFTGEEEAALAIAEETTELTGVDPDDSPLTGEQEAAVRWVAIVMNAFNRIAIGSHYVVRP